VVAVASLLSLISSSATFSNTLKDSPFFVVVSSRLVVASESYPSSLLPAPSSLAPSLYLAPLISSAANLLFNWTGANMLPATLWLLPVAMVLLSSTSSSISLLSFFSLFLPVSPAAADDDDDVNCAASNGVTAAIPILTRFPYSSSNCDSALRFIAVVCACCCCFLGTNSTLTLRSKMSNAFLRPSCLAEMRMPLTRKANSTSPQEVGSCSVSKSSRMRRRTSDNVSVGETST